MTLQEVPDEITFRPRRHRKHRLQRRGKAQYVTGLTVSDRSRPRLPRKLKRRVRQILYYRKDVLANTAYQEKFKSKLNYELPNPPKSMKEMHDVAEFFTGWDWNGDGKEDWGISLHAKSHKAGCV